MCVLRGDREVAWLADRPPLLGHMRIDEPAQHIGYRCLTRAVLGGEVKHRVRLAAAQCAEQPADTEHVGVIVSERCDVAHLGEVAADHRLGQREHATASTESYGYRAGRDDAPP